MVNFPSFTKFFYKGIQLIQTVLKEKKFNPAIPVLGIYSKDIIQQYKYIYML